MGLAGLDLRQIQQLSVEDSCDRANCRVVQARRVAASLLGSTSKTSRRRSTGRRAASDGARAAGEHTVRWAVQGLSD